MGKEKEKSKYDKLTYTAKREADKSMAERYGVDLSLYGNTDRPGGGGIQKKSWDDLSADVAKAAANDYDVRRSIEAAKLSGNKKAEKVGNISNASEAYAATRFMEKTHKNRMGNGGAYDGANDQGGVTKYWIDKERSKQNAQFATKDDLSALDVAQKNATEQASPQPPVEDSPELAQAKERVQNWESGGGSIDSTPNQIFGAKGSSVDFAANTFPVSQERDASGEPDNNEGAQSQLDSFKQKLKDRKNFQQDI